MAEVLIDHEDITILNSYVEICGTQKLKYLIYEMQVKDTTGEYIRAYKAIKLLRIKRLPKNAKQETKFMDIHSELLGGMWERQVNLVAIIANILNPVPLGLLFCYGVQGVSGDVNNAKKMADEDYAALCAALQGAYRTIEFSDLTFDEIDWLRDKMSNMKQLSIVRGLPYPKQASAESGSTTFGGKDLTPDSQETTEEFVGGMSDKEYVVMMVSTPVATDTLEDWLTVCSKRNTKWQSQMQGSSGMNFGLSMPMMFMASAGASEGWSQGTSDSASMSHSHSDSHGTSSSESFGQSASESFGQSASEGIGDSSNASFGQSHGVSAGHSASMTSGESLSNSHGMSSNQSASVGENHGINESYSQSQNHGISHTEGSSLGVSDSTSVSQSHSKGISDSNSFSEGHSSGHSASFGSSYGQSENHGRSDGNSWGFNGNSGHTEGENHGQNSGYNYGTGRSGTINASVMGVGGSITGSENFGRNWGTSDGTSSSDSISSGWSDGGSTSNTDSYGKTEGHTSSEGTTSSDSFSRGHSTGTSESWGQSTGQTHGVSRGASVSDGETVSQGTGHSVGSSSGVSLSTSKGSGTSDSISKGITKGSSEGNTQGTSDGVSSSQGNGTSHSLGNGTSHSLSSGTSHSVSKGSSQSQSDGVSWGNSHGVSNGFNGALNSGMSGSMGIGPNLSFNKSYQFIDVEVRNLVEIYEFQNLRLNKALNGQGAFFVDMYIATPDDEAKASATTLAKSAWGNNEAKLCPLQVLDLEGEEKDHLFYHFASFSACNTLEGIKGGIMSYKYSTILLADEMTAYCHPVRMSEGGQLADIENIPILRVPSMMKGEIFLGKVLSGERWNKTDGYRTKFDYRIDGENALHHIWIQGASRSGKTVMAMRLVTELLIKTKRYGKRLRGIILDPKQDWRTLGKYIESDRFKFRSLGDPDFFPIKLNLLKIPRGVRPQLYADGVIEGFCRAYQLGEKVKPIIRDAIYTAYKDAGVFCKEWKKVAPELSKQVTFSLIYQRVKKKCDDMKAMKASFNIIEAYERLLDRMDMFAKDYTVEYQMFCQGGDEGLGIDDILGEDDVTVLESFGLDNTFKAFVFGLITTGIYQYAYAHPGGFKSDDQYSTVLVIEEANEVLIGSGEGSKDSPVQGTSMFEKIVDQAAGLELFICAITQKIADMPQSIIANCGLNFALKSVRETDKAIIMDTIGKDARIDDKNVLKFLPKMPTGWCIAKTGRSFEYAEQEAVLLQVERLDTEPPKNEELARIIEFAEIRQFAKKNFKNYSV